MKKCKGDTVTHRALNEDARKSTHELKASDFKNAPSSEVMKLITEDQDRVIAMVVLMRADYE